MIDALPLWRVILALNEHVGSGLRGRLLKCVILMLFASLAELVTIGAVLPLLTLLVRPEAITSVPLIGGMLGAIGEASDTRPIIVSLLLLIAAAVGGAGIRLYTILYSQRTVFELGHQIGSRLFSQLIRQPYSVHLERNPAEILVSTENVRAVTWSVFLPLMNALAGAIIAVPITLVLFYVEPVAAGATLIVVGAVYMLISRLSRRRLEHNSNMVAIASTGRMKTLQEAIGGIREILISHSQDAFDERYRTMDADANRGHSSNLLMAQAPRHLIEAAVLVMMGLMVLYFASRPEGLTGSVPMLGALALGAQRLLPVFQQIYNGLSQARGNAQVAREVLKLFENPHTQAPALIDKPLPFASTIRLDRVSLAYGDRTALHDLSLEIPKGACIGLVGSSGSGKSSLINLLSGLLQPTSGSISIDGVPLGTANIHEWQARLALVPQEIYLADMSIAANIAFPLAPSQIDPVRLREAARQARIDAVIEALPHGYDTVVGDRGMSLAGGQRQRIAIARALYRRADVLIFDEATSALDGTTQSEIMATIASLAGENTVILATHRLSNLRVCDLVIRLDHGRMLSFAEEEARVAP